ncbi:MAG: hypothetical protein HC795_18915 [Coleofasciculaceae cyanobacterium RL_1_1]|nr:hypothetical protein [Coleofasciculaceae cyanobacterium RL_1_1]
MEFKITAAEAHEMAKFEEEIGCNISAGPDWGIHLDRVMELALNPVDREKFIALLSEQLGSALSQEEIEEVASSFQIQIQERLARKISTQKSA